MEFELEKVYRNAIVESYRPVTEDSWETDVVYIGKLIGGRDETRELFTFGFTVGGTYGEEDKTCPCVISLMYGLPYNKQYIFNLKSLYNENDMIDKSNFQIVKILSEKVIGRRLIDSESLNRPEMEIYLRSRSNDTDFIAFSFVKNHFKYNRKNIKESPISLKHKVIRDKEDNLIENINYYTSRGEFGLIVLLDESDYYQSFRKRHNNLVEYFDDNKIGHASLIMVLPQNPGEKPEILLIDMSENVHHFDDFPDVRTFNYQLTEKGRYQITYPSKQHDKQEVLIGNLRNFIKVVKFLNKDGKELKGKESP